MKLSERTKEIRKTILQVFKDGTRGHVPSALSLTEILTVLYGDILCYRPEEPLWADRDRLILSKGHGCIILYTILAELGFFEKKHLKTFCHFESILGGHPKFGKIPGVEASTGSLGHGLAIGVGQAISLKLRQSSGRVFVVMGDGECNEGSVWEAAMSASKHALDNLTVIVDYNHVQSYGPTEEIQPLEPFAKKWEAFGFSVTEIDGHDTKVLFDTFTALPLTNSKPSAIICHTTKGKGIKSLENNLSWHHKARVSDEEVMKLMEELENA